MKRDPFDDLYDPSVHSMGPRRKKRDPLDDFEDVEFEDEEKDEDDYA